MCRYPFLALLLLSCQSGSVKPSTTTTADLVAPEERVVDTAVKTILAEDLRTHVARLASDDYEGRETLTPGYERAATYMAEHFARYGLVPLPGQKSFAVPYQLAKQSYDPAGTTLRLRVGDEEIQVALGSEATPFSFSDQGQLDADVVFAGYGITAKELDYDDYRGLNVKGKWVLVLRHAPGHLDAASAFFGGDRKDVQSESGKVGAKASTTKKTKSNRPAPDPRSYSTFVSKALNAQAHGAKGMLLVSGPLTAEMPDDLRMPERLSVPLSAAEKVRRAKELDEREAARAAQAADKPIKGKSKRGTKKSSVSKEASLLAFHIAPSHAQALLANTKLSLLDLQKAIDEGAPAKRFKLKAKAFGSIVERKEPALVSAINVIAYLEGSDPLLKDEFVVIGGHFDHLGRMAGELANTEGGAQDVIFNGADDNASGTAGVLELAQAFSASELRPRRSMLFMGFSAEEKGLLGSRALVKQGPVDSSKIAFMLNLDMIGRNSDDEIEFVGGDFATDIREITEAANTTLGLDLAFNAHASKLPTKKVMMRFGPYAPNSDHHAFFEQEVPVAFFFTGTHADYHRLSDHADKLDYPRMQTIVRLGYGLARGVADADTRPSFIHKLGWLGASIQMIDSAATITSVESDSRASKAGLLVGDRIAAVGDRVLTQGRAADAEGSSRSAGYLLDHLDPGTSTPLRMERDGSTVDLNITRSKRGYLGIFPGQTSDDLRQKLALSDDEGVLIASTSPEAPAYKSGLRVGDIITKLAGHSVNNGSLMSNLARIGAGEVVTVQIIRNGERLEMPLTLGEPPSRP